MVLVFHAGLEVTYISSSSMSPTLNGPEKGRPDHLLIERLTYRVRSPRRWELVSFHNTDGILVAKRVVGLPGEVVSVKDGNACIDGVPLSPPDELRFLYYLAEANLAHGQLAR